MRKALVGAILLLCSALASAQTVINVLYVYAHDAVIYEAARGLTPVQSSAMLNSQANGLLISAGIQVNNVGTINGAGWCCGAKQHFWTDDKNWGAMGPRRLVQEIGLHTGGLRGALDGRVRCRNQ